MSSAALPAPALLATWRRTMVKCRFAPPPTPCPATDSPWSRVNRSGRSLGAEQGTRSVYAKICAAVGAAMKTVATRLARNRHGFIRKLLWRAVALALEIGDAVVDSADHGGEPSSLASRLASRVATE